MKKPVRPILIASILGLAILAALGFLILRPSGPREPKAVTFAALIDPMSKAELAAALEEYNSLQTDFAVRLISEGEAETADLVLGPYQAGGLVWRSQGWRLWARQETLTALEAKLGRTLLLPFREGRLDGASFETLLKELAGKNTKGLIVPENSLGAIKAFETYLSTLGGDGPSLVSAWRKSGLITLLPTQEAIAAIVAGKAVFLFGNESLGARITRSEQVHPESFPLPGSVSDTESWIIGRADSLFPRQPDKIPQGTLKLIEFLTSKGMARRFTERLPGTYYFWTVAPQKGKLPLVPGPQRIIELQD